VAAVSRQLGFTDPVSGRKVEGGQLIEQIMPAPGVRVRACIFQDGKPLIFEILVIGWALVTTAGSINNDSIEREVELLCAHTDGNYLMGTKTFHELDEKYGHDFDNAEVLWTGDETDDKSFIEETRRKLESDLRQLEDAEEAQEQYEQEKQVHSRRGSSLHFQSFQRWRDFHVSNLRRKLGVAAKDAA
jgi:hypothetical protein